MDPQAIMQQAMAQRGVQPIQEPQMQPQQPPMDFQDPEAKMIIQALIKRLELNGKLKEAESGIAQPMM